MKKINRWSVSGDQRTLMDFKQNKCSEASDDRSVGHVIILKQSKKTFDNNDIINETVIKPNEHAEPLNCNEDVECVWRCRYGLMISIWHFFFSFFFHRKRINTNNYYNSQFSIRRDILENWWGCLVLFAYFFLLLSMNLSKNSQLFLFPSDYISGFFMIHFPECEIQRRINFNVRTIVLLDK